MDSALSDVITIYKPISMYQAYLIYLSMINNNEISHLLVELVCLKCASEIIIWLSRNIIFENIW